MGVDFIRKAAKSFHKGLDQSRVDLSTPNLFTVELSEKPRAYTAIISAGNTPSVGEELNIRLDGDGVVLMRGLERIGALTAPTQELLENLKASHGVACGKVEEVYKIADTAEISVC